jgi:hypothetical protein
VWQGSVNVQLGNGFFIFLTVVLVLLFLVWAVSRYGDRLLSEDFRAGSRKGAAYGAFSRN